MVLALSVTCIEDVTLKVTWLLSVTLREIAADTDGDEVKALERDEVILLRGELEPPPLAPPPPLADSIEDTVGHNDPPLLSVDDGDPVGVLPPFTTKLAVWSDEILPQKLALTVELMVTERVIEALDVDVEDIVSLETIEILDV